MTTDLTTDVLIEVFDADTAPEEDFRPRYELEGAEHAEFWSEDPRDSYERWRDVYRHQQSWRKSLRWSAYTPDRSQLVGRADLRLSYTETNRNLAGFDAYVLPEFRRRGIARRLLREVVEAAGADERTLLGSGAPTDTVGTKFLESLGAVRKMVERKSRMIMADLDRDMLEDWLRRATERSGDYSLMQWDGPAPEEYLEKWTKLSEVMNTAPRDDLEMEDSIETPERLRENEARAEAQGIAWWSVIARHDPTDELVGFTEIGFLPEHPEVAEQWGTGVDPAHRNHGLGRWLKAVNALRLMDEKPDVAYVDTFNAYSNDPMLAINIAMGFEVVKSYSDYQIPTETLKAALAP